MTPEQQSALEALSGRALTDEDAKILDPWLEWDVRNDAAIAAHLSLGRTAVQADYWLTDRGLVADLVAATGSLKLSDAILDKLDKAATASRSVRAMLNRLETDARGLNFGDASLRSQLPMLGVFDDEEISALLSLAVKSAPFSTGQISDALNIAEGRVTLG